MSCRVEVSHRAAEAARDKAELARRGAEKREKAASEELAVLKERLEAKSQQVGSWLSWCLAEGRREE